MNRGLFHAVDPIKSSTIEPGRLMTSDVIMKLATQTEALRQASRTKHTIIFPDPATAPYATITDTSSYFDLKWNNERTVKLFHLQQKGHQQLRVNLRFAIPGRSMHRARVQFAGQGISADVTEPRRIARARDVVGRWQLVGNVNSGSYNYRFFDCYIGFRPASPTDYLFNLRIQIQKGGVLDDPNSSLAFSERVYLYSAEIMDHILGPETPTP